MKNIELKYVQFSNFMPYGNNVNRFDFKKGMTWVSGESGNGKSAIVQAICVLWFGEPYTSNTKLVDLKNTRNKSKTTIIGEMIVTENEISDTYLMEREITKSGQKFTIHKNGVEVDKKAGLNQTFFEENILGMSKNIFQNIVSLNTLQTTPFIKMEAKKKREFIESILSLSIDKYKKLNGVSLRDTNMKLEMCKSDLIKYNDQLKSLHDIKSKTFTDMKRNAEQLLVTINDMKSQLEPMKVNKDNLQASIDSDSMLIAELKSKFDNTVQQKYIDITNYMKNNAELPGLLSQKSTLELNIKSVLHEIQSIVLPQDLTSEISSVTSSLSALNNNILMKKQEINSINAKIQDITNYVRSLVEGSVCGECGKPTTKEDIEKIRQSNIVTYNDLKSKLKAFNADIDAYNSEVQQLNARLLELNTLQSEFLNVKSSISSAEMKLQMYRSEYDKVCKSVDLYQSNQIDYSGYANIDEYCQYINSVMQSNKAINDEAGVVNSRLKNNEMMISNVNSQIVSYESSISTMQARYDEMMSNMSSETIEKINSEINDIETKIKDTDFLVLRLSDELKICKYIDSMYDESGIKRTLLSVFVPNLNDAIRKNIIDYDIPCEIIFNDSMEYEYIPHYGFSPSFNLLSQGQYGRVNFAITMAFRDFVTSISGVKVNFMFLDEVIDSANDVGRRDMMYKSLRHKLNEVDSICVMSHSGDSITQYFDHIVQIKHNGSYASIN